VQENYSNTRAIRYHNPFTMRFCVRASTYKLSNDGIHKDRGRRETGQRTNRRLPIGPGGPGLFDLFFPFRKPVPRFLVASTRSKDGPPARW
jgi:hypothetical protein